jgi:hypothetical protein
MTALLKDYPLKALTDSRSAMAAGLAKEVAGLKATVPRSGTEVALRAVYDTWSSFEQRAMSSGGLLPAAAVLPDRPVYEPSSLTPRALEDTWSGGDPNELLDDGVTKRYPIGDGSGDGFVLYSIAEMMCPFVLVLRAQTKAQRKAFAKRLEEHFVEDGSLLDPSTLSRDVPIPDAQHEPIRYGRRVELANYYNRTARFTLMAQQILDNEASARENRWLAQFELTGHVQVCVLRRGRAMSPRVQFVVNGTTENRA